VRDHRDAWVLNLLIAFACGADRPAIIQTGTETVPTTELLGARP
jgi:hypothetical protein